MTLKILLVQLMHIASKYTQRKEQSRNNKFQPPPHIKSAPKSPKVEKHSSYRVPKCLISSLISIAKMESKKIWYLGLSSRE